MVLRTWIGRGFPRTGTEGRASDASSRPPPGVTSMDSPSSCPSDPALRDLVSGRLPEPTARRIHEHLVVCGPCRRRTDNLETEVIPEPGETTVCPSQFLHDTSPALGDEPAD